MNEQQPEKPIAHNAPGFDEPVDKDDGGADRVFDVGADLTISPIKEEAGESSAISEAPIQFIPQKPRPTTLPSHTIQQNAPAAKPPPPAPTPPPPKISTIQPGSPLRSPAPTLPHNPFITITPPPKPVPPTPPPTPVPPPDPQPPPQPPTPNLQPSDAPSRPHPDLSAVPQDPNIKPLRTYEDDVAQAMARGQSSVATIAIAESKKREEEAKQQVVVEPEQVKEPGSGTRKAFLILLILVFLSAGVIGAYYLYSISPLAPSEPVAPDPQRVAPSIITSDSYAAVETDNVNATTLQTRIEREVSKTQPAGTIKEIIPTKMVGVERMRVGGPEMIGLLDISLPDILLRSLDRPMMIGVYADPAGEKSVFAVVTTAFFQNTFAGMLQWESVMADDLKYYLFSPDVRGVANVPTSQTATSTSNEVTPLLTIRGHFVDRIIKNKDVRAFLGDDGRILFLYSFVDNTKLVLTNKESTLAEILTRLEKARAIR